MGTRIYGEAVAGVNPPAKAERPSFFYLNGRVDFLLLLDLILLVVFGLFMLYSASTDFSQLHFKDPMFLFTRQVIWVSGGIIIAVILSFINYKSWQRFALLSLAVTLIALVVVIFTHQNAIGSDRVARSGSIQPSELAKVVTIIYISVWLYSKRDQIQNVTWGIIPLGFILGAIGGLIILEPDYSAGLFIFILGGLLFFLGGGDIKQLVILILVAAIAGGIIVVFTATGSHRISEFLSGLYDPTKSSDHVLYSWEAIVKGGIFGVGLGKSTLKVTVLPLPATDSIFSVIAEELGLVGVIFTICFYLVILWRGLQISKQAPDMLGSLLAIGMTIWICMDAILNMLVMVGLMPFAGNALPLVSYGGSNVITTFAAIGILMSVSRQTQSEAKKEEWRGFGASFDLRGRNRRRSISRTSRTSSPQDL